MDKLVRDKIPQLIRDSGKTPVYETLEGEELQFTTINKINEEVLELSKAFTSKDRAAILEELADVEEIVDAFRHAMGITVDELLEARVEKIKKRGAFNRGYYLNEIK